MKLPKAPRVVITGAASGLGRAFALELARRSGRILIADIDAAGSEETLVLVRQAGGDGLIQTCDVTQAAELEALADTADKHWGGTDLLINNAGVAAAGPIGEVPLADWEWLLRINLWGVLHGCQAFVPRMKAQNTGRILNVASCAGVASLPEMGPYNVSKAAVISLSETLNAELSRHGIQVSVLCPTFFQTNLMQRFRATSDRQRELASAMFRHSFATAESVARAGVRGVERRQLMIMPQMDGKLLWLAKRVSPGIYARVLGWQRGLDMFGKLLTGKDSESSDKQ